MSQRFIFSSESVGEGHPDKVCDLISDAVLDACLAQDKRSRVACECYVKSNVVVVRRGDHDPGAGRFCGRRPPDHPGAAGSLVVVWVPSALTMAEQLHMAAAELGLTRREPRCMACGGALVPRPKEEVRPRIPPRTALWKDEYFVCAECDRLFWRGTHWERIERTLRQAVAA